MIVTEESESCALCNVEKSVVYCDGCGKPLCKDCRKFDLWGYGCGHVDTKAFCRTCYNDITINPYGGRRE